MSKLLTCLRYAVSKVYPNNIDLSAQSTFYVTSLSIQAKDLTISKTTQPK